MLQLHKNTAVTNASLHQADIRQKELDFYTNNYVTWGGTSTITAGFVFSQLTNPVPEGTDVYLSSAYLVFLAISLGFSLCVITWTTLCCMWGPGMALRGPEGMVSFHKAIDFLKVEQNSIYNTFIISVFSYFASTCCLVWVFPSDSRVNMAGMVVFATALVIVVVTQLRLEYRIGGSLFPHEGADGRLHGFSTLEDVADLDNHLATTLPEGTFASKMYPGMY